MKKGIGHGERSEARRGELFRSKTNKSGSFAGAQEDIIGGFSVNLLV
jgi:hypothetical protein